VDILSKGGVFLEPFMLQLGIFFRKSALVRIPFFAVANPPLYHVFGLPVNFENEPIALAKFKSVDSLSRLYPFIHAVFRRGIFFLVDIND